MATKKKLQINPNGTLQDALQQLVNQYNNTQTYTAKTSDQLKAQAKNEYGEYYNQLRLGATQAYDRTALALQQQRDALNDTYNQQREASRQAFTEAISQADRHDLSRGMQRSTYNGQVTANLRQKGNEAQQNIWDQQAKAEGNIDAQQTQLAQQLADQLKQYSASEAADVLKRIRELEDQEYERGMTDAQYQNSLAGQIYSAMQQAQASDQEQQRWQQQFDYQMQRDTVADQRYDQQFEYQKARDTVSDQQWQQQYERQREEFEAQMAYQKERANVSDAQWEKQYQQELDKFNKQFEYQQQRDTVSDQQWQQEFQRAVDQYNQNMAYQRERDTVNDQQWQQQYNRQREEFEAQMAYQKERANVSDAQWEKEYARALDEFNKKFEYQQSRDTVSDEQWERQFAESVRQFNVQHPETTASGGGGYSGGSSSKKSSSSSSSSSGGSQQKQETTPQNAYDILLNLADNKATAGNNTAATSSTKNTTVKTLQGPINLDVMNAANAVAPTTGITFRSALADALNNKTATTKTKSTNNSITTNIKKAYNTTVSQLRNNALDRLKAAAKK